MPTSFLLLLPRKGFWDCTTPVPTGRKGQGGKEQLVGVSRVVLGNHICLNKRENNGMTIALS